MLSFWTYLALGARHALVPRILCLTRWSLAPHGNGDAGVGEYEHQQRHDELQREQGQRVVVILSTLWPNFAANVSDVDVRQAGCRQSGYGTAGTHNDDGAVTRTEHGECCVHAIKWKNAKAKRKILH